MGVLRFYWLRHAPPINPGNICYGADIAVDLSDVQAIKRQADRLPRTTQWKSSPMPRAVETTQALLAHRPLGEAALITIEKRDRLREQSFGDWVGKPRVALHHEPGFGSYIADPVNNAPPGGENIAETALRANADIYDIIAANPNGGNVVIGAHKGIIRIAIARAIDLPLAATFRVAVDPLSLTVIEYNHDKKAHGKNPWTLVSQNINP